MATIQPIAGENEQHPDVALVERVRAGMRRARLEGRHIGRRPLEIDRAGIERDRASGMSLAEVAKAHRVSRATIHRVLREQARPALEQTA